MISKSDIDMDLLDESEPVILAHGGSQGVGYKYSKFYNLKLYYVPTADMFVLTKSSINGVSKWSFNSLENVIQRYNRFCEDSYKDKLVSDVYDVPDYVVEEVAG